MKKNSKKDKYKKNKIDKDHFEKKTFIKIKKKNHVGKHCSNS
jgi:hypothetical protein